MMKPVIVDIDGTLADCEHRRHHVEGEKKDWDAFFEGMDADVPIQGVVRLVEALDRMRHPIVLITGRYERYRQRTIAWLLKWGIPYDQLIMRPEGTIDISDVDLKRSIFRENFRAGDILFTIEDRASVVKMWREEGLLCLQCAPGEF